MQADKLLLKRMQCLGRVLKPSHLGVEDEEAFIDRVTDALLEIGQHKSPGENLRLLAEAWGGGGSARAMACAIACACSASCVSDAATMDRQRSDGTAQRTCTRMHPFMGASGEHAVESLARGRICTSPRSCCVVSCAVGSWDAGPEPLSCRCELRSRVRRVSSRFRLPGGGDADLAEDCACERLLAGVDILMRLVTSDGQLLDVSEVVGDREELERLLR